MKTKSLILSFGDYSLGAKRFLHGETLSDPAIVLLHDALGCMATWREFPQALFEATGLDVVMFDRRGHGASSSLSDEKRTSAYLEDDARRLPEILDKLRVRRAILVGHSDGGSIALVAAALYPERVQSVVAMAAHVFLEEVTLAGVRDTVATAGETRLLERLQKYHGEKSERLYRVWHETWLAMKASQTPSPGPFPMNGEGEIEAEPESELPSSIYGGRVGDGGRKVNRFRTIPKMHWQYAREMRKEATDAEKILWKSLSKNKLGVSFRRQHPIGPFIADFFASSIGLVIEVDGGVHLPDDAKEYDSLRDERMHQIGLTVLRFTNDDVLKRLDWVLDEIRKQIQTLGTGQTPSPGPFPMNGEGESEQKVWSLLHYLPLIQCPVLVMQGELDEYGTVEQVNAIVKGVGEKARAVMYPGVGHAVWREGVGDVVGEILHLSSNDTLSRTV